MHGTPAQHCPLLVTPSVYDTQELSFFPVPGQPFPILIAFFLKLYSWAKLAGSH